MSRTPLNFIAHVRAKPGAEQTVHAAIEACVAPTRAEPGCIDYDLHRNADDPAMFVLYEGWESQAALDAHMHTAHFRALGAALEGNVVVAPDGRPFTGEALTMLTDRAPPKP